MGVCPSMRLISRFQADPEAFPTQKSFVVPAKRGTVVSRGRAAGGLAQLTSNSVGVGVICDSSINYSVSVVSVVLVQR